MLYVVYVVDMVDVVQVPAGHLNPFSNDNKSKSKYINIENK
jgi:hypothetical protein